MNRGTDHVESVAFRIADLVCRACRQHDCLTPYAFPLRFLFHQCAHLNAKFAVSNLRKRMLFQSLRISRGTETSIFASPNRFSRTSPKSNTMQPTNLRRRARKHEL